MTTNENTSVIAFFSAENFFRLKTAEKQRQRFDSLADAFKAEFERDATDDDWQALLDYQNERARIKRDREQAKIEREANKAAKLEAMPIAGGQDTADEHIASYPAGRYVLTVAQNNTKVDKDFLNSLHVYCRENNATLLVAKTLYNKKAFRQPGLDEGEELWFDPEIKEYLVEGHLDLGGTHFIADANVIVTAKWPTSGFGSATPAGINAIIPASRIELRVGAALKGAKTKIIAATGAVTKRNYILRKTGTIAAFNHSIGAVMVDTTTNELRHLEQVKGAKGFYDLSRFYSPDGSKYRSNAVAALQFGDIHAEKMETANLVRAIELIQNYQPDNIVLHDVLDFSSRNHHNIKDPVFLHKQHVAGNSVRRDLQALASILDDIAEEADGTVHIVESNHDLAINTWLKNADFKIDPLNATVYLECMLAQYKANEEKSGYFNMLKFAYTNIGAGEYSEDISFHETDESLVIAGVEMGNHGHNGVNGSRGSPKQFAELGTAMNTGHTHSPSIYGPVYTAGVTASLEMDYNKGASSWAIADVVTYENGQRQIWFS